MTNNTKDTIQYSCAVGAMVSGMVLSFISFFMSGDVQPGVLTYLGIMVSFAGAVFGISVYAKNKLNEIEMRVDEEIKRSRNSNH